MKLNITGGEPFIRPDFMRFLYEVSKASHLFNFGILSNGSYLDERIVKFLKKIGLRSYQVSLEGLRKTNDSIRGEGSFDSVINSIRLLRKYNIIPVVSLTLTRSNSHEISHLANILYKSGASVLGARRMVPIEGGKDLEDDLLNAKQLNYLYKKLIFYNKAISKQNKRFRFSFGCETGIFNEELEKEGLSKERCAVIDGSILCLMPDGTIYPCRRLPINVGNIKNKSLLDIWQNSEIIQKLRDTNKINDFCKNCNYFDSCLGGAKCITYASTGNLFSPDVNCLKYEKYKKIYK
ncbi:MAG: radical SAM protein [Nanobdellota archaeon]